MKGIIVHCGQYGSTEQYAKWISEESKLQAFSVKDIKSKDLPNYDFFILGTSVIAYKFLIAKWIIKNWHILKNKKIFLYVVSGTQPEEISLFNKYKNNSFNKEIQENIKFYYFGGRQIFKKLPFFIRTQLPPIILIFFLITTLFL
ncbi:MAG TPA: flavodoxin domain-containing protein, partial [Spirochaetota bacterium]|nr:flavodoxin domain-containing protein [Spirochaetota bacterium]HPP05716.1 flavodoxin domain-containing protein [Spirochaetota bacterium]